MFKIYLGSYSKPFTDDYYKDYALNEEVHKIALNMKIGSNNEEIYNKYTVINDFPSYTKYKPDFKIINKSKDEWVEKLVDNFEINYDFSNLSFNYGYIYFVLHLYNIKENKVVDKSNSNIDYGISVSGHYKINFNINNNEINFYLDKDYMIII